VCYTHIRFALKTFFFFGPKIKNTARGVRVRERERQRNYPSLPSSRVRRLLRCCRSRKSYNIRTYYIYIIWSFSGLRGKAARRQRTCRHGSFVPGRNESESEEQKKNGVVPVRGINKRCDDGGGSCRWPLCGEHRILCHLISYVPYFCFRIGRFPLRRASVSCCRRIIYSHY